MMILLISLIAAIPLNSSSSVSAFFARSSSISLSSLNTFSMLFLALVRLSTEGLKLPLSSLNDLSMVATVALNLRSTNLSDVTA